MHYNLLFNGCSFTKGAELEGFNQNYEYRRTHRFSHLISEQTGLTYANISRGGASNKWILRTTAEWFEEGNTCDHAIIQWTNRSRLEIFTDKGYYTLNPVKAQGWQLEYFKTQTDQNDQDTEDCYMYWMEQFLKDRCSFDYLKLRKEKEVCKEYYEQGTYYKYRTKFPITYIRGDILSEKGGTEDYCFKYKNIKMYNGSHPSALGHRKIADYIINNFDYFQ